MTKSSVHTRFQRRFSDAMLKEQNYNVARCEMFADLMGGMIPELNVAIVKHERSQLKPWTPYGLNEEMFARVKNTTGNCLIIGCVSLLKYALEHNLFSNIVFVADNSVQQAFVKKVQIVHERVELAPFLCDSDTKKWKFNMLFDVVVGNPPYSGSLHLEILHRVMQCCPTGDIVFVHPGDYVVRKFDSNRSSIHQHVRREMNDRGVHIEFIDNPWSQGAGLYVPLVVSHTNSSGVVSFNDTRTLLAAATKYEPIYSQPTVVDRVENIFQIGDYNTIKKIIAIVQEAERSGNNWKSRIEINDTNKPYFVNICRLLGSGKTINVFYDGVERKIPNQYSFINNAIVPYSTKITHNKQGNPNMYVKCMTEAEAINANDFLRRNTLLRCIAIVFKIDQHAADTHAARIPWLDWTIQWDDEQTQKHFGFTDEDMKNMYRMLDIVSTSLTNNDKDDVDDAV